MAVQNFSTISDSGSTANFRIWGAAISAALQAYGGLAKTTDTGQIDWTTVTVPAGGAYGGYEIYRLTDSLQATSPVFIKIRYGVGSGGSNRPAVACSVGTATDGAGNLTSMAGTNVSVLTEVNLNAALMQAATATNPAPCTVNGDSSSLIMALWNVANLGCWLLVERNRNPDGTPNGDATFVSFGGTNNNVTSQVILHHNQVSQSTSNWPPCPGPTNYTTGIKDSIMGTFPVFTGASPRMGAPSKFVVGHIATDLPALQSFTITHYGASHTFVSWNSPRASGLSPSGIQFAFGVRND